MIKEMQDVSQRDQCALLVRQTEAAQMALTTAYREPGGPSEAMLCPACENSAEFVLRPDGGLVCDDCHTTVGCWAMRPGMAVR